MEFNSTNIEKGDEYEFDISKYFFADTIRVIILIYIIISFIFNYLIIIKNKFNYNRKYNIHKLFTYFFIFI